MTDDSIEYVSGTTITGVPIHVSVRVFGYGNTADFDLGEKKLSRKEEAHRKKLDNTEKWKLRMRGLK